jgi:hypothetical protein
MFKEPGESAGLSFEQRAKRDTFESLYGKIVPLIADENYEEVQREIKSELSLLAGGLGGAKDETLANLRKEFDAFLPEEMRFLVSSETPAARGRIIKNRAAKLPDLVPEDDDSAPKNAAEALKEGFYGKLPTSFEEAWQRLGEWWRRVEDWNKKTPNDLRLRSRFDGMSPNQIKDQLDAESMREEFLDEHAEDTFLDFWEEGMPVQFKLPIVDRLIKEKNVNMLGLLYHFGHLAFLNRKKIKLVESELGLNK